MDESEIRELKVVDLVNSFPVYGSLTKSINRAAQENTLPFETVGEMLDAGSRQTHKKLQSIDGIGPRAADQFFNLLRRYMPENLFVTFEDRRNLDSTNPNRNRTFRRPSKAKNRYGYGKKTSRAQSFARPSRSRNQDARRKKCERYEQDIRNLAENNVEIRDVKIVDVINYVSPVGSLSRYINQAIEEKKIAIETVGDFLEAGEDASDILLSIPGFGPSKLEYLYNVLRRTLIPNEYKKMILTGRLQAKFPDIFSHLIQKYKKIRARDVVRKQWLEDAVLHLIQTDICKLKIVKLVDWGDCTESLSQCVRQSVRKGRFPFETIGDFLYAKEDARLVLLLLEGFTQQVVNELYIFLKKILSGIRTESRPERRGVLPLKQLASTFPGLFSPLINEYKVKLEQYESLTENERLKFHKLETRVLEIVSKKTPAAEIIWRWTNGERIPTIAGYYGLHPSSAREIIKKYRDFIGNIETKDWVDENIQQIIKRDEKGLYLPSNEEIHHHHTRLAEGLLTYYSEGHESSLTPTARLEIARCLGVSAERGFSLLQEPSSIITRLNHEFPGLFDPLTKIYTASGHDPVKQKELEGVAESLLRRRTQHTDMLQRRYMGETLQEIGERYGLTRERVRQLTAKYKEYTTDTESREWIENAIRDLISGQEDENRLPPNKVIDHYHPKLSIGLIKNFTSKNGSSLTPALRLEIAENLGLDREHELLNQTRWNIERVVFEVKNFASEIGKPDLMPMQLEMAKRGRQDLRGIIQRFGGQAKVAELAGLKYQGQLVAPDGSRQYWTDERIKEFLYEVAEKNGHPGVMPTQRECREYAPSLASVISGITQVRTDQPGLTWFEVSQRYGLRYVKGVHQVTLPFIKAFVKSLGDALYSLSPAEIYVLFEQQGIAKAGDNLHRSRTFDNLVEAIQSGFLPKEEIEKWVEGGKGDLVETLLDPEIQSVEEAFNSVGKKVQRRDHKKKEDNPSDEAYREDVDSQLPLPTSSETLDALQAATNVLIHASSDEEAVQFLVAKAADKLWKRCFLDEDATFAEAKQHQGNTYSEAARNSFIEEYTRCKQLPIPEEYSFRDPNGISRQPKLMQRLIAYRVLTQGRVLNLSGTGTGKTLSAVLASRVIGARLTVVACPNATVEAWRDTILNTFPRSEVITKPPNWQISWGTADIPRYVVVNHEMFQNRYEGRIKRFIEEQAADLIVIDELHKVKQRTPEQETQRRRLLTGLITDLPDSRPKPRVLGMSATPIINNLQEGKSLVELVTSMTHDEIGSKTSVQNCMRLYQRFMTLGFRMLPKQEISREPKIYPTDATPYLEELLELGEMPHPQKVEAVLVRARWPIIRQHLRKKTVVFTEYVMDIVPYLTEMIRQEGFSVGVFTGEEKLATVSGYQNMFHQFIEGETDILVASIRTLGTGVDGLQYVCNNIIFATLPWTSTDYEQAVGRFDREGFVFDSLDIHIPKTYAVLSSGQEWSWCESRLLRIENKKDIAKAAVDGEIPDTEGQLSPAKATQYWMGWLKRLNDEGLQEIERREIKVPLDESDTREKQRRRASYGDFANLNARWNRAHSSVTHNRLAENPEEWCYYHTRLLELEKSWQVNPRIECIKHLKENLPKGAMVGDFGCGQGHLTEGLKDVHTVHSFDHIAIRPSIVSCDMSNTPLDDGALDAVVFSLSLMGSNLRDYISEAYRTLKLGGQLLIWHPADHHDRSRFVEGLKTFGFAIVEEEQIYKWHRIWAIKQARRTAPAEEVRF